MSKMKKPRCQRQITLHFNEDTKHILELFEQCAKEDMRTVESEILFELNGVAKAILDEKTLAEERAAEPVKMVGDFVCGDDSKE